MKLVHNVKIKLFLSMLKMPNHCLGNKRKHWILVDSDKCAPKPIEIQFELKDY